MTPAISKPLKTSADTIIPDMISPKPIKITDRLKGTSKRYAAKDPVHAPVNGKGIATKETSAKAPYRLNLSVWSLLIRRFCQLSNFPRG